MDYKILVVAIFFIIFISIQYTINKVLYELREIRKLLLKNDIKK